MSNLPREHFRWSALDASKEFGMDKRTVERKLEAAKIFAGPDECYSSQEIVEALFGGLNAERRRLVSEQADGEALQNCRLRGEVLDRTLVVGGLERVFLAVKQIILASDLDRREKDDILSNIAGLDVVIENIVEAQGSNLYQQASKPIEKQAEEDFSEETED